MKQYLLLMAVILALCLLGCTPEEIPQTTAAPTVTTAPEITSAPTTEATEPPTEIVGPAPARSFTAEEEELLLKLGMAERGDTYCTDCIALVMCTVLNRVDIPGKYGSTIKGVIYAEGQFTPVAEGTLEKAVPNFACKNALEKVKSGWDESQGALYYEWGKADGWHAKNLNFLFKHCETKFYN